MKTWQHNSGRKEAFTLLELLIVIGIIVVLASITVPAIKGLTKGNDNGQSVNLVRAMLSSARAIAVSQHRQAGVVFFEETSTYSLPVNSGQTAMQVFVEDYNQAQYAANAGIRIYVPYSSTRQYLPSGIKVATLSDSAVLYTGNNTGSGGNRSRAILFDADGNLLLSTGLGRPDLTGNPGQYPFACGDWNFNARTDILNNNNSVNIKGVSSPGFFIFSMSEYAAQPFANDGARTTWIKQNATPIIVNANTGMIIR